MRITVQKRTLLFGVSRSDAPRVSRGAAACVARDSNREARCHLIGTRLLKKKSHDGGTPSWLFLTPDPYP